MSSAPPMLETGDGAPAKPRSRSGGSRRPAGASARPRNNSRAGDRSRARDGPGGRPPRRGAAAADAGGPHELDEEPANTMKNLFSKELPHMMYGYGDDVAPLPETVALVEEMLVAYITDLTHKLAAMTPPKGRPNKDDLMLLLRKDHRKLSRVKELLRRDVELKDARKLMDADLVVEQPPPPEPAE